MSNPDPIHYSFLNEDLKKAGVIIQDMTAELLCDPSVEFNALSEQQKNEVFSRILRYVEASDDITSPEKLHLLNNELLTARGWTNDHFNIESKSTPLLCEFNDLPVFVKTFVQATYQILKALVLPHSHSMKEAC
ncbi:hypothetical protein [Aliivibrio salmonicida]|uniref:hypothetical protein n=1 Tax=Aliivibrio salmonicida TaxID=40269 RepID=UPI003D0BA553